MNCLRILRLTAFSVTAICLSTVCSAQRTSMQWAQGPGPRYDFTTASSDFPSTWSVVNHSNIRWQATLPETGQSAPIVVGDRVFVTTMQPVQHESSVGNNIVVYCFAAADGSLLWKQEVSGGYMTKLSAPFGDASAPSPVSDGTRLWVLNPTGTLACFDMQGKRLWQMDHLSVSRTQPILWEGKLILHRQVYRPDEKGHFTHENRDAPLERWTQLQALDCETGKVVWTSTCGANMGCVPLLQTLSDGSPVLVVGRGGGHGPPEKPEGVSMIDANDGTTLWTLPLPSFMSTQTYPVADDQVLVFHKGDHLWVDAKTGKISQQRSIVTDIMVRRWTQDGWVSTKESLADKKPRSITQQSNLRVGKYHYFRSYTRNYLGRVNIHNGQVEYLELPIQVLRQPGHPDVVQWRNSHTEEALKRSKAVKDPVMRFNNVTNSRGIKVMGDARAQGSGWGHICAPIPTAAGDRLIVPLMSGLVFVIDAQAEAWDETAVLGTNDLGPLGDSFTRASLTPVSDGLYAHTIGKLIAIGSQH